MPIEREIDQHGVISEGIFVDVSGIKTVKHNSPNLPFGDYIALEPIAIANELLQAPASYSPQNMLNILCDHILRDIFKDPKFNSMQLLAISNVCKRFNDIANDVGTKRHTGKLMLHNKMPYCGSLWLLEDYLRMYGHLITTVETYGTRLNGDITYALVSKYCENVVAIKGNFWNAEQSIFESQVFLKDFHGFDAPAIDSPILPPIAPPLTPLLTSMPTTQAFLSFLTQPYQPPNMQQPSSSDGTLGSVTFFGQMKHLKSLHLIDTPIHATVRILSAIFEGNVELETLQLERANGFLRDCPCYKRLKCLKSLTLTSLDLHNVEQILNGLSDGNDAQLETLKIQGGEGFIRHFTCIGRLHKLKSLVLTKLHFRNTARILDVLAQSEVRLERLELIDEKPNDQFVKLISEMKFIKYLRIDTIDDASLMGIISKMEQLAEITTHSKQISFKGIRLALNKSKNLTKVRLHEITPRVEFIERTDLDAIDELRKARSIDLMVDMGPIRLRGQVCENTFYNYNMFYSKYRR